MTKHYTVGDLTVIWKPEACIHSTVCWKGLKGVFDPRKRPWINMDGAPAAEIMEQVSRCPSGALSYVLNSKEVTAEMETEEAIMVEAMKNGPLMVYGNLAVKDSKGAVTTKSKVTAFCRCGQSANKPYCDGSHMRVGFRDE